MTSYSLPVAKDGTNATLRTAVASSIECFDQAAGRWASQYEKPTVGGYLLRERREKALRLLDGRSGRLLDIGCGTCVLAPDFVHRGFEYWGVDGAYRMVEAGGAVLDAVGGRACVADTVGLPFPDASFDVVVCLGVIDRVPDPARAAKEMVRVVRPGGVIITSFLNRSSPYYAWRLGVFYPAVRLAKAALAAGRRRPTAPDLVKNAWRFAPRSAAQLFDDPGLSLLATSHYNFNAFLPPVDQVFPTTAARVAERLSRLADGRLRFLGGSFLTMVVRASVPRPATPPKRRDDQEAASR